jgi:hypothetical protein
MRFTQFNICHVVIAHRLSVNGSLGVNPFTYLYEKVTEPGVVDPKKTQETTYSTFTGLDTEFRFGGTFAPTDTFTVDATFTSSGVSNFNASIDLTYWAFSFLATLKF